MLKTNFREQAENDPRAKGTVGIAISSPSPHLSIVPQRDDQRRSEDVAADGCHATLLVPRPALAAPAPTRDGVSMFGTVGLNQRSMVILLVPGLFMTVFQEVTYDFLL